MAKKKTSTGRQAGEYRHSETAPARPDVGVQPQFRRKLPPKTYRYDSSLSPSLEWDGRNPAREEGEARIARLETELNALRALPSPKAGKEGWTKEHVARFESAMKAMEDELRALKGMSRPFLNWAGKAERLSFDVPSLPLFVHERLSTKAILETLKGHRREKQLGLFDLFADPQRPIHDQVLRAYEYQDKWVNRMILGDSLVVMNSLAQYEGMAGQVQMIYMDPPYGVKFGSNFQPFVRKRDVAHNDDEDMTREPEMVQAYRDTWELGLHSYLSYMRDRLLASRDLLTSTGSIFVQISDDNVHLVRELLDEVFGVNNFVSEIGFAKTSGATSKLMASVSDYLLWYAKDKDRVKYRQIYEEKPEIENPKERYVCVETPDGRIIDLSMAQKTGRAPIPEGRILRLRPTDSQGATDDSKSPVIYEGRKVFPPAGRHWTVRSEGTQKAVEKGRTFLVGNSLRWKAYHQEFPFRQVTNNWLDVTSSGFGEERLYVVQTQPLVVQRCMHMTTDPGDLVVDPTCGSGTTAYVAEQWGRRWITIDTSRVPLALARQRMLTATYPWYELKDEARGPSGGFIYKRKQNTKGEEAGGIVPHVTLKSISNDEAPREEILVDRPEEGPIAVTRVTGPFVLEATIPTALDTESSKPIDEESIESADFAERMIEILRRSPVLRLDGGRTATLKNLRRPTKTLSLSAEATLANGTDKPIALAFGPENGAVVERLVYEAAREAAAKNYNHLYVVGFAIQPTARELVDKCEKVVGISATYVQATPDLMMGDLLRNMRSSQIFSVCGLPEITLKKVKRPDHVPSPAKGTKDESWYEVTLQGLDVFDPSNMEVMHKAGDDVPAWFLDTDYNALSFHVCQAFFPRTAAWDMLKRALKGEYEDSVWEHLAGNVSVPFQAGDHEEIAVKVIDDRGNELMVVKSLKDVK